MFCDFGCKQEALFILKSGKHCCSKSWNSCPIMKAKNRAKKRPKTQCSICKTLIDNRYYDRHVINCHLKKENIQLIYRCYNESMSLEQIKSKFDFTQQDIKRALKGQHRSRSRVMKRSHVEGRSNNWKYKESYAERFFNQFLLNSGFIKDKDYIREKRFSFYRADFFFPNYNLVLEIDGLQHFRFQYQKNIDKKKNQYLSSLGFRVVRIPWKVLFTETKQILNDFLKVLNEEIDFNFFNKSLLEKLII